MKILHINGNYLFTKLHQNMARALQAKGVENKVYVPMFDKNTAVVEPDENVCVSECFKKWDRLFFGYKQRKIIKDAEKKIKAGEYDCIHAYTLFTDGNTAMELSKKYGVPYLVAVRNTDVNSFFKMMPWLRGRGIKIMQRASAIFFLSETYRKQVFEKYIPEKYRSEFEKKSCIIPNGIDDFWFENKFLSEKKPKGGDIKLIFAGRIDKNKNVVTTQAAVKLLREKGYNATLTVVGKIADENEGKKIIADANTEYIPAQPKEKLIGLYREHDVFVMPSYCETFGLVYAEAMSQGLPVIYTKGQGFDGQFEEGKIGFHVEANSAEQIADAVIWICGNYENMSKECKSSVDKFGWDKIADEYVAIYQKLQ